MSRAHAEVLSVQIRRASATASCERGFRAPAREHHPFEPRLDDLALHAEQLLRPGPRSRHAQLIDGDPFVGVPVVVSAPLERRDRRTCHRDVAGARRPLDRLTLFVHELQKANRVAFRRGLGALQDHPVGTPGGHGGAHLARQRRRDHGEARILFEVLEKGGGGPDHRGAARQKILIGLLPGVVVAPGRRLHRSLAPNQRLPELERADPGFAPERHLAVRFDHVAAGLSDQRRPEPPVDRTAEAVAVGAASRPYGESAGRRPELVPGFGRRKACPSKELAVEVGDRGRAIEGQGDPLALAAADPGAGLSELGHDVRASRRSSRRAARARRLRRGRGRLPRPRGSAPGRHGPTARSAVLPSPSK